MKIPSSNLERTCCVQKLFLTFRTIFVHNLFSPCSAKRRASDKDLPVTKLIAKQAEIGIHPENKFVLAKKGKKKSRVRGNDAMMENQWTLSMLKCLTLQDCENIQQLQLR